MTATQQIGPFTVGQRVSWIDPHTFRLRGAELTGYDPETDLATLESGDEAVFLSGRELVARCVPEGRTPIPLDAVRARLVAEVGWDELPRPETDEQVASGQLAPVLGGDAEAMSTKYAEGSRVSAGQSLAQIRKDLERFGATAFRYAEDEATGQHWIEFTARTYRIRLLLQLPALYKDRFWYPDPTRTWYRPRSEGTAREEWGKECRRLWRSFAAIVKAKLVAIDDGIRTVEEEFEPDIVTPDGQTFGRVARLILTYVRQEGRLPPQLVGELPPAPPVPALTDGRG